jgi:hypothetical protein
MKGFFFVQQWIAKNKHFLLPSSVSSEDFCPRCRCDTNFASKKLPIKSVLFGEPGDFPKVSRHTYFGTERV